MKLKDSLLLEFDPVALVQKDVGRQMSRALGPHKNLRQMESALKGAMTLSPLGLTSNSLAVALAHKEILQALWDSMQTEETVADAFENAAIMLSGTSTDFKKAMNPNHIKQGDRIMDKEFKDAIKLLNAAADKNR